MSVFFYLCQTLFSSYQKGAIILLLLLHFSQFSTAQPPTDISGVVNTYHQVIELIPDKACVRVTNASQLSMNNMIMIIQMKGATINTSNTSSFGDTTALNAAGDYEIGTICYISNDSVFLFHNLLNSYDVLNGKVQVVQFAEYLSANVTDTIKASAWDSTAGTGGVIAIYANQSITLNAPVFADASGYKGGKYSSSNGTCSNFSPASSYAYNAAATSPQNGAYKGESVATIATTQTGGRGAPANGGGGGNNHNNSGGGGANLSAGGIGGGNSSSSGCRTTIQSDGGNALKSWGGKKIFLGGGGGAGHNNNAVYKNGGGNGGGIIFIWANELIGNNELISSNGETGGNSLADGAGGAGAGGSIIMHVTNYTGNAIIQANGGNGGASNDGGNIGLCYGGGGGGSGGVIYFTGAAPPITATVTAGAAGVESGRDPGCNTAVAAQAGSVGSIQSNYSFSRSTSSGGFCQILLPIQLINFTAGLVEKEVKLEWELANTEHAKSYSIEKSNAGNRWISLTTIIASPTKHTYNWNDKTPASGMNMYRLKIIQKDNVVKYSPVKKVMFSNQTTEFNIYPNPASQHINISGNYMSLSILKLADITGKIIWQQQLHTTTTSIMLPRLSPGIYLVQINERIQKLVIR